MHLDEHNKRKKNWSQFDLFQNEAKSCVGLMAKKKKRITQVHYIFVSFIVLIRLWIFARNFAEILARSWSFLYILPNAISAWMELVLRP